jgi:hypothetical protein
MAPCKAIAEFLIIIFMFFSVSSCSPLKQSSYFQPIENNLQSLLDDEKIILCGTIEQFHIPSDQVNDLLLHQSTDFLCSDRYPFLYESFSNSTIKITGKIPFKENPEKESDQIDPFYTNSIVNMEIEHYRGYIQTDHIHFEGIFQYDPTHQTAQFTIADSLLERIEQNEK